MPYTVCIVDAQYICNEICIIRDLVIIFKEDSRMSDTCGCGCGHDHDDHVHEEMEMETLTLTLDDDTEMECGILGVFAVDGIADKEYIALLPLEDETVLLYEYKENEDGIELLNIESDDDFEKVSNTFYDLFDDEDE